MANAARSFSLTGCTITLGGYIVSGFGPDDAISIAPSNEAWSTEIGGDGDISFFQKPVYYTATLTLSQTSKTNDVFSAVLIADKVYGTGVLPFAFVDSRGTSKLALTASRIVGEPTAAFGTSAKTREWKIAGVGSFVVGGN